MEIDAAIKILEAAIDNPEQGLPEEIFLFLSRITPMVNVDLLIKNGEGETLLTWRDDSYNMTGWHVPGGIVRYKEEFDHRIHEVARLELGAEVEFEPEAIAINRIILPPERKIRGHFVSLLYQCKLLTPLNEASAYNGDQAESGQWAWHASCPENLLDVQQMYKNYFGK